MNIQVNLVISFAPEVLALLKLGVNPEGSKGTLDVPQAPEENDDDILGGEDEEAITREKVRALASEKTNAGQKDAVIAILKKAGAKNIKELPEAKFDAVYKALQKL